jgi:hypothetical protein
MLRREVHGDWQQMQMRRRIAQRKGCGYENSLDKGDLDFPVAKGVRLDSWLGRQ